MLYSMTARSNKPNNPKPIQPEEGDDGSLPGPLSVLGKSERALVKSSPWQVAKIAFAAFAVGCIAVYALYSIFLIPGKDATIQQLTAEREGLERKIEEAGLNSSALKARADVLIHQLEDLGKTWSLKYSNEIPNDVYWAEFNNRGFNNRLENMKALLDEHGQYTSKLDKLIREISFPIKDSAMILEVATELKKLTGQLKE